MVCVPRILGGFHVGPIIPLRISHGVGLAGLGVAGGDVKPPLTKTIGAPNAFFFSFFLTYYKCVIGLFESWGFVFLHYRH